MPDDWREAWRSALDELELTLELTERLLGGELPGATAIPSWTPPVIDGPMPEDYAFRARILLGRQQALITQTLSATVAARQRIDLLDKLTGVQKGARPEQAVYVDLTA